MNKDDMSDEAQFEAFLRGDDELARTLQAMPQAEPSPELDAAILQRVQLEHARRTSEAANDAQVTGEPALSGGMGKRWRLPVGIAASVLIGVLATQMTEGDRVRREAVLAPPAELPVVAETTQAPPKEMPPPPPPPETAMAAPRAPLVADVKKADRQVVLPAVPAPAPAVQVQMAEAPPPAPVVASAAPAPSLERAAGRSAAGTVQKVEVTGSSIRREEAGVVTAWLDRIEALLEAGKNEEALAEWEKFRAAHREHRVSDALQAKIKAASD